MILKNAVLLMEKYFNINYEFSPQEVGRRIDEQLSKNESDYICVADGVILNNANRKPDYLKIVNEIGRASCRERVSSPV